MRTTDAPPTAGETLPLAALVATAVGLFLALRLGLSLLGAFMATRGVPSPCAFEEALNGWRTLPELLREGPAFSLAGVWERWDACWYMKVATYGYEPGERSVAFFPLFPASVRLVGTVTALPLPVAGLLVAAVAYVAAMVGVLRLVVASHGPTIARRTVLLISVFPAAFFLLAPFTEALFLAAAAWTLVFAGQRRWLFTAACATLAGLTRAQGVLLVLPIAWLAFLAARDARAAGRLASLRQWAAVGLGAVASIAPLVAFIGYGAVAYGLTGETPVDAQALWGGTDFHPPWAVVTASLQWTVERGDPLQALNLASLIGAAGLLVVGARRIPVAYALYAWPPLLLVATRLQPTPLTSTTRYVLVLFPVFVVVALLLKHRLPRLAWVVASVIGLVVLAVLYLSGDFVA